MSATDGRTALLLDGRGDDEPTLGLIHEALADGLAAAGWAVDDWRLRDEKIAWCTGCFGCWTKTPGVCAHADAGREVARRIARSDLLVYLTPVTLAATPRSSRRRLTTPSPSCCRICAKRGADTRHPQRYERRHDLLVVARCRPAGPAARRRARSAGWWSATPSTCSPGAGQPACSSAAPASGRSA